MRISRKKRPQIEILKFRINERIKAPRLRLVDDEGSFLGIMSREEALRLAEDREMDLVEIVPKGEIPVAKITDYGRFKYQKEKEEKKKKSQQKKVEIKGIRLSLRIGEHDTNLRIKQAVKFLENGDKVKIELRLKGRERGSAHLGKDALSVFIKKIEAEHPLKIDQPVNRQGGRFFAVIAPTQKNESQKQEKTKEIEHREEN